MMQKIRDKAQGIVAWVIVGMVAFVLCFWGVSGYISSDKSSVLAKVNGTAITSDEVNDIYNRWLRMNATQKGFDITQIDQAAIKNQIMLAITQKTALVDSLTSDGLTISDAMLVQTIKEKTEFQKDGKFAIELYKEFLSQANLTEADFEAAIREELLVNQLQLAIMGSSFATPQEAKRIIELKNQTRDFGYTIISAAKFAKNARITDSAIEEFYNSHKAQFVIPDRVQVEYIELSINDLMKQITVTDQKLQEYYNANVKSFAEPRSLHLRHIMINDSDTAQQKIDEIYAEVQKGGNFVALAKIESDDKQSAVNGGDLGWVTENDNFPAAVYALNKPGEYTKPIKSDFGWHIFELIENKGGGVKSFASVKDAVLERYKRDAAEHLFSAKGEELANLTFENPRTLAVASDKLQLPIKTSDYFTKQGGAGIAESSNVLRAAFSDDVYGQENNSELIRLSDDSYVVLRVKDKQPSHEQPLADARNDIENYLQRTAARDEAKQIGDELLATIKQTNNPNKAASNNNLSWDVKKNVERDGKDIDSELLKRVFLMPRPEGKQTFTTAGFTLPNGDYVVVAVTKVTNGVLTNAGDSNLVETVAKQIANFAGRVDYASLQQALVEQAKIKYY